MPRKVTKMPKMFCASNVVSVTIALVAGLLILHFLPKIFKKEGFESTPAALDGDIKEGKKLVMFYADWCGHCKNIKPAWDSAAKKVNGEENKMVKINVGGDDPEQKKVSKKYGIDGFPTIQVFNNGSKSEDYSGGRSEEDLVKFVQSM